MTMCLAIPGKIISIINDDPVMRLGRVTFGGIIKDVHLSYVPDSGVGDYVIIHAGFAISKLDEDEAKWILDILDDPALSDRKE